MALVLLPCDLPWWPTVQRHLTTLIDAKNTNDVIDVMLKLHALCNVGLDPDEPDGPEPNLFLGLREFFDSEMDEDEKQRFLTAILPNMVARALELKHIKPISGLLYSLQQQPDRIELDRKFIASLLAHAFFSTFPKRTAKTHPTLVNFNFSYFFQYLDKTSQKAKLRCLFRFYESQSESDLQGTIKFSRQVLSGKEWLTIEDWLESGRPLCPLLVRHEGGLETAENEAIQVCFSPSRVGSGVLTSSVSQESIQFITQPEVLAVISFFECLEDNEALIVEGLRRVAILTDPKRRAVLDLSPPTSNGDARLCCIDAEDNSTLALRQYEEDSILRDLNKAFLGFRQPDATRRLSPIGESFSSTPPEGDTDVPKELVGLAALLTKNLAKMVEKSASVVDETKHPETNEPISDSTKSDSEPKGVNEAARHRPPRPLPSILLLSASERNSLADSPVASRRCSGFVRGGRRALPLSLAVPSAKQSSIYTSCQSHESDEDEYLSARGSVEEDVKDSAADGSGILETSIVTSRALIQIDGYEVHDPVGSKLERNEREDQQSEYQEDLESQDRRTTFAERLKDALLREHSTSTSEPDSESAAYAVDIRIAGADVDDPEIRIRRGGSCGFQLGGDEDDFTGDALELEQQWIEQFKTRRTISRKDTSDSSRYSFSTDCGSEFDALCEEFGHWLDDPSTKELGPRDLAVFRLARNLLKRTLSDSFAGVADGMEQLGETTRMRDIKFSGTAPSADSFGSRVPRSLSLTERLTQEKMAMQAAKKTAGGSSRHLAARMAAPVLKGDPDGPRPIATGNWGCGHLGANPQLKAMIQWLAASRAGVPVVIYYSAGHPALVKLDTVSRVLLDRHWTVGELTSATLRYAATELDSSDDEKRQLFDDLIGAEKPMVLLETEL